MKMIKFAPKSLLHIFLILAMLSSGCGKSDDAPSPIVDVPLIPFEVLSLKENFASDPDDVFQESRFIYEGGQLVGYEFYNLEGVQTINVEYHVNEGRIEGYTRSIWFGGEWVVSTEVEHEYTEIDSLPSRVHVTRFEIDQRNPGGESFWELTYNESGLLSTVVLGEGQTTYTYDERGGLQQRHQVEPDVELITDYTNSGVLNPFFSLPLFSGINLVLENAINSPYLAASSQNRVPGENPVTNSSAEFEFDDQGRVTLRRVRFSNLDANGNEDASFIVVTEFTYR